MQNTLYNGTDFILFTIQKFLVEILIFCNRIKSLTTLHTLFLEVILRFMYMQSLLKALVCFFVLYYIFMYQLMYFMALDQRITNTHTKHPTNPTNQGIIKESRFALFFRSRIIAIIIMANQAIMIIYPSGTKNISSL